VHLIERRNHRTEAAVGDVTTPVPGPFAGREHSSRRPGSEMAAREPRLRAGFLRVHRPFLTLRLPLHGLRVGATGGT
jgi:hypothetical protein